MWCLNSPLTWGGLAGQPDGAVLIQSQSKVKNGKYIVMHEKEEPHRLILCLWWWGNTERSVYVVSSILKDVLLRHKASSNLLFFASLLKHQWLHRMNLDGVLCWLLGFSPPAALTYSLAFAPAAFPLLGCLMNICNPSVRFTWAWVTFRASQPQKPTEIHIIAFQKAKETCLLDTWVAVPSLPPLMVG